MCPLEGEGHFTEFGWQAPRMRIGNFQRKKSIRTRKKQINLNPLNIASELVGELGDKIKKKDLKGKKGETFCVGNQNFALLSHL